MEKKAGVPSCEMPITAKCPPLRVEALRAARAMRCSVLGRRYPESGAVGGSGEGASGHVAWATERSRSLTAGYGSRGCGEVPPSAPPLAIEMDLPRY